MANSKYEYVKKFELEDKLLPSTFIVIRIDGRSFHKFTKQHNYEKPNDPEGLNLMNEAAKCVMREFPEIIAAYGQSDEFSFLFGRNAKVYQRRSCKLVSAVASVFSSSFVFLWNQFMPSRPLLYPPSFDSRAVCYPTIQTVRDYFSWRQADCHINNLYNTCFWKLVQSGKTEGEAEATLAGTFSKDKNEMLFTEFKTNYNDIEAIYRKGSVLFRSKAMVTETSADGNPVERLRPIIDVAHVDIIKDDFWKQEQIHNAITEE